MILKPETADFPVAIYSHEEEAYWYVYSLGELIAFLNEHDCFFTFKCEPEETA